MLDVSAVIWTQQELYPTKEGGDAAAAALAIPELLEHIMLHVHNRDELASFKIVSQLWEAAAERVEQRIPKKQPVQQINHDFTGGLNYYFVFDLRPWHCATYTPRGRYWSPYLRDDLKQDHRLETEKATAASSPTTAPTIPPAAKPPYQVSTLASPQWAVLTATPQIDPNHHPPLLQYPVRDGECISSLNPDGRTETGDGCRVVTAVPKLRVVA